MKAQEEIEACLQLAETSGAKADKGKEIPRTRPGRQQLEGPPEQPGALFLEMPANMPVRVLPWQRPALWSMGP
jgi:hypothetical protein